MQIKKNKKILRFIFPFYPINIFKSTHLMLIFASLIALRIVFQLFSISIPGLNMSISFSWVPVMIIGWFYGPIIGFIGGMFTDTICYFIFPGSVWFWMYAIQEACVAFISGIISGICYLRKNAKSYLFDLIFQQIVYIGFALVCYVILLVWANPGIEASDEQLDDIFYEVYKWIALSLLTIFLIIIEIFTFTNIKNNKKSEEYMNNFIYGSTLVVILMVIFSFLLGPVCAIEYYKFIHNGQEPSAFIKYGTIFYLIPRVALESIKVPIEASLMTTLIACLNPSFNRIVNNHSKKWKLI